MTGTLNRIVVVGLNGLGKGWQSSNSTGNILDIKPNEFRMVIVTESGSDSNSPSETIKVNNKDVESLTSGEMKVGVDRVGSSNSILTGDDQE
jgi:hypothetical protein